MKGVVVLLVLLSFPCVAYYGGKTTLSNNKKAFFWGFYGHHRINRMAVFTLPPEIFGFYKKHIEYITEHAVDPDKRRFAVKEEGARHYIDIDHYVNNGENPFDVVPKKWNDAVEKLTEDTLRAYGIVPWHIETMARRLTYAFKDKNVDLILKYSAELGHYVADAHVPLHTTENYNGQMTNQKGIHGLWESRLPELFADKYDYFVGKAEYVKNINEFAWKAVKSSNEAVDSVFLTEKQLSLEFPPDQKYSYETRGRAMVKTYSQPFSEAYHTRLNNMVERRMCEAIIHVGSIWYTCWVDAGQPDLSELENKEPSEELKQEEKQLDADYQNGKTKSREHDE